MKRLFVAVSLMLLLFAPAAQGRQAPAAESVQATPALWVVKDADTTLYLFGTIHLLDPKYRWFDGPIRSAFESADELVVETRTPSPDKVQAIVARLAGAPGAKPLAERLPAKQAARYRRELADAGLAADALDRYQPWFAAVTISMLQYGKAGMSAERGADTTLIAAATAADKTIVPLETFEQQLGFFSAMSETEQLQFLAFSLDELARTPDMIGTLTRAWTRGDVRTLTRVMNKGMRAMPLLAKRLLDDRNARWADWIADRLTRPGTVFVAVGAGHLGGDASVQVVLAKKGIVSTRLQ